MISPRVAPIALPPYLHRQQQWGKTASWRERAMTTSENLLRHETSPYLLQHADNPVAWRPWGAKALAEARETNRPILLSIGYAACHWCHVMAHESFENPEIAALMNRLFVPVKVDREERPDIDGIYMTALHALGEQGGWPLTMFLTPEGDPFWGGTYFPPTPRYGRPSFPQVLEAIAAAWAEGAEAVTKNRQGLSRALQNSVASDPGDGIPQSLIDDSAHRLLGLVDMTGGGMRGAPKFPNPPIFRFLWQNALHHAARDPAVAAGRPALHLLLRRMADGGIHDHLGGGFARYSTDAEWLAPHFEKMLYDNGQLLELLALAEADRPDPAYREAAGGIVAWLTRDMAIADEAGGRAFAASEDADSEGHEGTFYVWREAEIDAALGVASPLLKAVYDVTPGGNWEGHTILRRLRAISDPVEAASLAASRKTLFRLRARRPRPALDDKVLTDWNALAITGLCRAARVFDEPDWLDLAEASYAFLQRHMRQSDGRYLHSWRQNQPGAAGLLDDQSAMAGAALALYQAGGDARFLEEAENLVAVIDRWFGSEDGSVFTTAADATDLPAAAGRPRGALDQAVPSGSGLFADALARLFHLTGEPRFRDRCDRLIRAFSGTPARFPNMPGLLQAADTLEHGGLVVVTARDPAEAAPFLMAAAKTGDPSRLVLHISPSDKPGRSPDAASAALKGRSVPSAVLCRGGVCSLPVDTAAALAALLHPSTPRDAA
jgi:uncharacterized protein